ncbi:hypothetical protein FHL15_009754 [Xylaria flabelliformis]|uniref:Uncharacterized protein n=1 Tax=Xylaria flabelliformis TaxID=2512241 RepID=A0A553HN32_9PEZI|nr:hypothetical protein FHL15_009754 [Xylaria flabelliformis]
MPAVIAPRAITVNPKGLDHSPNLHVQQQHNYIISNISEKRAGTRESPTVVRANQQSRAAAAIRQSCLNQHIRQEPANTNISYDELVRQERIREAKEAAERVRRASRLLQQVTAMGPTGGYSPLAKKLLMASHTKKQRAVPFQILGPMIRRPRPPTSAPRQVYPAISGWTRDSGNGAGLPPLRAGRDHVAKKAEIPDLSKSPEITAFTGKRPYMNFVGSGMPTSNTMPASPVQRKRKRYIEDCPTQEMPLGKRR